MFGVIGLSPWVFIAIGKPHLFSDGLFLVFASLLSLGLFIAMFFFPGFELNEKGIKIKRPLGRSMYFRWEDLKSIGELDGSAMASHGGGKSCTVFTLKGKRAFRFNEWISGYDELREAIRGHLKTAAGERIDDKTKRQFDRVRRRQKRRKKKR